MSFNWLNEFHREMEKPDNYAAKTLAQYRLGIKAKGSIMGVRIEIDREGCEACQQLDETAVYHPDDAPHLPLAACTKGRRCGCVYRPVMNYE
jgi:hypothetical protein